MLCRKKKKKNISHSYTTFEENPISSFPKNKPITQPHRLPKSPHTFRISESPLRLSSTSPSNSPQAEGLEARPSKLPVRRPPRNNALHLLPHLVRLARHPIPEPVGARLGVLDRLARGTGSLGGGRPDVGGGGAKDGRCGA